MLVRPRGSFLLPRPLIRSLQLGLALTGLASPIPALADFARPPESPYAEEPPPPPQRMDAEPDPDLPRSAFRFQVGPALLLEPSSPGLITALDIGQHAVGARVSAAWLRAATDRGLSSYSAELWVDFRHRYQLHPILGAGASYLRGGALGGSDAGAGLLRGALEYELPIRDAEARLGLSIVALVPAIASERTHPWALGALTVSAGF
jgi:hypothetical protein